MWGAPAPAGSAEPVPVNWVQDALPHAGAKDNAEPANWVKVLGDDRQLLGGGCVNNVDNKGDKSWTRQGQCWIKGNGNAGDEDEEDAPQRRRATTCDQGTSISGTNLELMGLKVVFIRDGEDDDVGNEANDVDTVDAGSSENSFLKVEKVKTAEEE